MLQKRDYVSSSSESRPKKTPRLDLHMSDDDLEHIPGLSLRAASGSTLHPSRTTSASPFQNVHSTQTAINRNAKYASSGSTSRHSNGTNRTWSHRRKQYANGSSTGKNAEIRPSSQSRHKNGSEQIESGSVSCQSLQGHLLHIYHQRSIDQEADSNRASSDVEESLTLSDSTQGDDKPSHPQLSILQPSNTRTEASKISLLWADSPPDLLEVEESDRKPTFEDLEGALQSMSPPPSQRPSQLQEKRLPAKEVPEHLLQRRTPFLKRTLPPAITHRKWGGKAREVHVFLSHSEKIYQSTQKIGSRPDCMPGQYSVSNPALKYRFTACCPNHAQIQDFARLKSWLFSDACPWCVGTEEHPVFSTTNVPDLLTHLKQHSSFRFEARRDRSQKVIHIVARCQHDGLSLPHVTPTPLRVSPTPLPAQASTSAVTLDTEVEQPDPAMAMNLDISDSEHRLVPYAHGAPKRPYFDPQAPGLSSSSTFMDLALSHAQTSKDWASSIIPPAAKAQGARYTPSLPAGWDGSKKDKRPIKQVHYTTKKPYLRSLDFVALREDEECSDSEDDDGDNYQWESRYQQMRLADQPDVDPNVIFMQQIWFNTCRSMGDAHRSRPYEACLRLVTTYAAAIRSRNARKELVEHLASMASLHTITPDQAEVLVQRYDRKSADDQPSGPPNQLMLRRDRSNSARQTASK